MYEREVADKNYYRGLILRRIGVTGEEDQTEIQKEDWLPIRKPVTLSQARRMASEASKLAKDKDLNDSEKLFQERLNEAKKATSVQ